jgi:AraC-like DNA-binding protein
MAATVLTSWALLVWQTLQDKGIDPRSVFNRAGLDVKKLGDGNARYSMEKMQNLWALTEDVSGDSTIGIQIGNQWHVTTFHALGFAWLASNTFKEAINRMARYARLVNNSLHAELTLDGPHYRFAFNSEHARHLLHPIANDAAQAAILKMCRSLLGENFRPLEIRTQRPSTNIQLELENYFQCPYTLGCEKNYWILDRFDVEKHLPTSNPELAHANDLLALNYLTRIDKDDVVAQVCKKIMEQLPSGTLNEASIASSLNMSPRSLQRHLADEKHSFSSLLNETREELANLYIRNSIMSINEISYLLGFAEPASFTRAFRRWTGVSPSQFRRDLVDDSSSTIANPTLTNSKDLAI